MPAMLNWNGIFELFLNVNCALLSAVVVYWAKPLARGLSEWTAGLYERFPQLKALPGSRNAGTELNYKITLIFFRVMGTFTLVSEVGFVGLYLWLAHR